MADSAVLSLEEFVRRGQAAQAAVDAAAEQPTFGVLLPGSTATALLLPAGLSVEQWGRVGDALGRLDRATPWWIGDWLVYGEHAYGEGYAQKATDVGLAAGTVQNYQYVASRFEISRRRDDLSFQHHAAVASLDVRLADDWLTAAEKESWSVADLRLRLTASAETEAALATEPARPSRRRKAGSPSGSGGVALERTVRTRRVVAAAETIADAGKPRSWWSQVPKILRPRAVAALTRARDFLNGLPADAFDDGKHE